MGNLRCWVCILIILQSCNNNHCKNQEVNSYNQCDTIFDSRKWQSADLYCRGSMVNNLVKSRLLVSITQDSLFNLMGKPTETGDGFCTYLVKSKDTSIKDNYLLLYVELDTTRKVVVDCWISD